MENWEIVETVGTEEDASLVAGFLEAQGIGTQVESLLFHQEPATFGKLIVDDLAKWVPIVKAAGATAN